MVQELDSERKVFGVSHIDFVQVLSRNVDLSVLEMSFNTTMNRVNLDLCMAFS